MTQTKFVKTLSKNTGIDAKTISYVLDAAITEITEVMKQGDSIALYHFGTFIPKQRAAKRARNINAGTFVDVPARRMPCFKPSRELIAAVISSSQA